MKIPAKSSLTFAATLVIVVLSVQCSEAQATSRMVQFNNLATSYPANTTQSVTAQLWDMSTGGTMVFSEGPFNVAVDGNSNISFQFGDNTPGGLNPNSFPTGSSRFLDVVDGVTGLSSFALRIPLTAMPFALSPGPAGPQGPQGPAGDPGRTGPQGPPGAVNSVSAGNTSIIIGGTVSAPTVAVAVPLSLSGSGPVISVSATSGAGILGTSSGNFGAGVFGVGGPNSGSGVRGTGGDPNGTGVVGGGGGTGVGVTGVGGQTNGDGVHGFGNGTGIGVVGNGGAGGGIGGAFTGSGAGAGVRAQGSGPTGTALQISDGAIKVQGAGAGTPTPVFKVTITGIADSACVQFSHPLTDGDPNAILFITPLYGTAPIPAWVQYWDVGQPRWAICGVHDANTVQFNVLVIKP